MDGLVKMVMDSDIHLIQSPISMNEFVHIFKYSPDSAHTISVFQYKDSDQFFFRHPVYNSFEFFNRLAFERNLGYIIKSPSLHPKVFIFSFENFQFFHITSVPQEVIFPKGGSLFTFFNRHTFSSASELIEYLPILETHSA